MTYSNEELNRALSGGINDIHRKHVWESASGESQGESVPSGAWGREAKLAYAAVKSIPEAASEAFSKEHIAETLEKAAVSAGTTLLLTCISRHAGLEYAAKRVLMPALAVSSYSDLARNGADIYSAASDSWRSDKNFAKNVEVMKNSVGRFAVDLAVTSAAGGVTHVGGSHYFGWKAPGASGLAELNLENLRLAEAGKTTPFKMQSEGVWRRVDVHLPDKFSVDDKIRRNMLIGLDGILVKKQPGMAGTNGLSELANKTGSIAAFPHAGSFNLVPGVKLSSWQTEGAGFLKPGSWLVPKAKVDDTKFIGDVNSRLKTLLGTDQSVLVGFSEGGNVAEHVAAKLGTKEVQGLASIEGTVTGREAAAVPGLRTIIVRGTADPTIPYKGGPGGLTKFLVNLGHDAMASAENAQGHVRRYVEANEFQGRPLATRSGGVTEAIYPASQAAKGGEVRFYKISGGKHAYPGRSVGKAEDKSALTGFNGGPSAFDINSRIGEFLLQGRSL